jgi:hypothetical protein
MSTNDRMTTQRAIETSTIIGIAILIRSLDCPILQPASDNMFVWLATASSASCTCLALPSPLASESVKGSYFTELHPCPSERLRSDSTRAHNRLGPRPDRPSRRPARTFGHERWRAAVSRNVTCLSPPIGRTVVLVTTECSRFW